MTIVDKIRHTLIPIISNDFIGKYSGKYTITGSYLRDKSLSGDIDILYSGNLNVLAKDPNFSIIRGGDKMLVGLYKYRGNEYKVDVWHYTASTYETLLFHTSATKTLGIIVRKHAMAKNMKFNQYGLFDDKDKLVSNKIEKIFEIIGIKEKYIDPLNRKKYES